MIVLCLRTDKPESEIALYDGSNKLAEETWEAHRQLAETLHKKIEELLKKENRDWHNIEGIVVYEGPGSFTGLRIGISVANALAYSNNMAIVGCGGENWAKDGINKLMEGKGDKLAMPFYGSEAHITSPKK